MEKISLFATDLDGTLFYDRINMNERDRQALKRLKELGCTICFATGREVELIIPAIEQHNLWDLVDYFLMCGGSQIYDVSKRTTEVLGEISTEDMHYIYNKYHKYPTTIIIPRDNILHTNKMTDELKAESELLNSPIQVHEDMTEILDIPNPKFLLFGTKEQVDVTMEAINEEKNSNITICRSQNEYIDCYAAGVDKGTAIKTLCERLNIPLCETASIGDNQNDIDMFKVTKFSACPANGSDGAKESAQYNVCHASEGAVFEFCEKLGIL